MTLATALEFATMVTVTDPRQSQSPGGEVLSPREQELLKLVGQGRTDDPRSPNSSSSACTRFAPTSIAFATRPDAVGVPISPGSPCTQVSPDRFRWQQP